MMKKHMIIVKGEIKTAEIKSCEYNNTTQKIDVVYYNSSKCFSYAYDNVEWIKEPKMIDHTVYRFYRNGREFYNIEAVENTNSKYIITTRGDFNGTN